MKGYLRTIAIAESTYFATNLRFARTLDSFDIDPVPATARAWIEVADSAGLLVLATDPSTNGVCHVKLVVEGGVPMERGRTCDYPAR